jgi:simple sugar transport system permease protein
LLQRRLDLPDASVLVLQGFAFVLILASEALRGRLGELWRGRSPAPVATTPPSASPSPSSPSVNSAAPVGTAQEAA